MANSVDPDQMPQNLASDLGLHCKGLSVLILVVIMVYTTTFPRGTCNSDTKGISEERFCYFCTKTFFIIQLLLCQ